MSGRLIVCPTPIGNLEDITLRVLAALREADLIACEDTRRTGALLKNYGVSGKLVSYYEQNEKARAAELVKRMYDGEVVALVSDAGMPLVSDPGFILVRACVAAGLAVEVLPGPSAALAALVASALPADHWRFAGFLPRKKGELRAGVQVSGDAGRFESPAGSPIRSRCWPRPIRRGRSPSAASSPRSTRRSSVAMPPTSRRATPRSPARRGRARRRPAPAPTELDLTPALEAVRSSSSPAPNHVRPPPWWLSSRAQAPTSCTRR